MTVKEVFSEGLALTGFSNDLYFNSSDISSRMLSIVNTVLADIYYIKQKDGFKRITDENAEIELSEREVYDCLIYGIAAFVVNILGSAEEYKFFEVIYRHKKSILERKCSIGEIQDTFVKGCDC